MAYTLGCTRQAALERQALSCTYLAHHELECIKLWLLYYYTWAWTASAIWLLPPMWRVHTACLFMPLSLLPIHSAANWYIGQITHSPHSLTHSLTHSLVYPLVQSQLILLIFLHSWVFPGLDAYKQRKHGTSDAAQAEQTIPNTAASLALLVHSGHNLLAESPCSVQSRLKGTNPNHANCVWSMQPETQLAQSWGCRASPYGHVVPAARGAQHCCSQMLPSVSPHGQQDVHTHVQAQPAAESGMLTHQLLCFAWPGTSLLSQHCVP